jgi:D-amino-acid oxidase
LAQGLRPFRERNVRVERELRPRKTKPGTEGPLASRIVHSYGQGGAGWSLGFGCAGDVLELVEEALLDLPPRPMMLEAAFPKEPMPVEVSTNMIVPEAFDSQIRARL